MARDNNIYGNDETVMASRIASKALDASGKADIWGNPIDQSARGKGNTPEYENPDAKTVTSTGSQKPPKSKGN